MKTNIIKGGLGVLKVTATLTAKNAGTTMFARFPSETLFDWYPLNSQYTYRYSEKHDLYYLVVDTDNLVVPRYGVVNNKGGVNKSRSHIKQGMLAGAPEWVNEDVRKDNQETIDFAHSMGIITPQQEYNMNDILEGFNTFQKAMDALYDIALQRCVQFPENNYGIGIDKESSVEYNNEVFYEYRPTHNNAVDGHDEEARAQHVMATLNEEEEELYIRLGEVYTMLSLMQKIVIARG